MSKTTYEEHLPKKVQDMYTSVFQDSRNGQTDGIIQCQFPSLECR